MKIKHAIIAAAFLFMAGCETTGNTTGSGSTSSGNGTGTTSSTAGVSTSGTTNPASNSTNARGTLTNGATGTEGTATGTNTSGNTSSGTTSSNTNTMNPTTQSGTTQSGTTQSGTNQSGTTQSGTTQSGATPQGTTNNSMNQSSGSTTNAGTTSGSVSVPSNYQSSFTTRYPRATNVQWSRYNSADVPIDWEMTGWTPLDNDDYTVRYNIGTDSYYSWYDSQGNWIGTAGAMKNNTASLPQAVNTLLATKYKDYTISSVNTEYWKDRTAYEVEMKNANSKAKLLVDANGTVLKEKMKMQ